MKYLLIAFIVLFFTSYTYGQLSIKQDKRLRPNDVSMRSFLTDNQIDSALIAWFTILEWPATNPHYYCLLKQTGDWYLAKMWSPPEEALQAGGEKVKIKNIKLNAHQADSLLKAYKPDAAFRYTQTDLNKLPANPTYRTGDLIHDGIVINDGDDSHLAWFRNKRFSHVTYPNAGEIYRFAYPHVPKFRILSGLVKGTEGLLLLCENKLDH